MGTSASERSPSLRWVQQSVDLRRSSTAVRMVRSSVPSIHEALGAAPGALVVGQDAGFGGDGAEEATGSVRAALHVVLVHDGLLPVGVPGVVAEHGVDL